MNEEKFLKNLNKTEEDNILSFVMRFLSNANKKINNKKNTESIPDFEEKIVSKNIETIFEMCSSKNIRLLFDNFLKFDIIRKTILQNLDKIISIMNKKAQDINQKIPNSKEEQMINIGIENLFKDKMTDVEVAVAESIDKIIPVLPTDILFDVIQSIKGYKTYDEHLKKVINEELKNRKRDFAESLLKKVSKGIVDRELNVDLVDIVIEELLENEEKDLTDIDLIGIGSFASVYKIGEKVLKLGEERLTYKIPNHRRILQPLLRKNLKDEKGRVKGCIEVSDFVDIVDEKTVSDDEVFELYKEIRDDGLVWGDVRIDNIGRLRKDNSHKFYIKRNGTESINVNPKTVGFINELSEYKKLKKGQLVILDTDYIGMEEEESLILTDYAQSLEDRYQFEKRNQKSKKHHNSKENSEEIEF